MTTIGPRAGCAVSPVSRPTALRAVGRGQSSVYFWLESALSGVV